MKMKTQWINLIYKIATGHKRIRNLLTPVVGLSYFIFSSLFVVFALICDNYWNTPSFPPEPFNLFLGYSFIPAGLGLSAWCLANFIRVKGTPVPFNPPPKLVTTGPYAFVRNPMLGGIFLLLIGLGFLLQSVFLLFFFTPLYILINVAEIKTIEEPELFLRLGEDYLDYKKRTPMFFPRLWRRKTFREGRYD